VGTCELKFGAQVMVKVPECPAIGAVALRTLLPHGFLMHILFLMAGKTLTLGLVKFQVCMTTLAGRDGVHSFKRQGSKFMIKARRLVPAFGLMALCTFYELGRVMNVVPGVARLAICTQLIFKGSSVTLQAAELLVFAGQWPSSFWAMVEARLPPLATVVATATFFAIPAGMDISAAMASYTVVGGRVIDQSVEMTGLAWLLLVSALKREVCFCAMIKLEALPVFLWVTAIARLAVITQVNIFDAVATDTAVIVKGILFTGMAATAWELLMLAQ
jgi:hypothetical protein